MPTQPPRGDTSSLVCGVPNRPQFPTTTMCFTSDGVKPQCAIMDMSWSGSGVLGAVFS